MSRLYLRMHGNTDTGSPLPTERKVYRPETLLQPEDVASVVVHALMLPPTAEVTDVSIRPMIKS